MSLPVFTELNAFTALSYAYALASMFGLGVLDPVPSILTEAGLVSYEYLLSDGSSASVWLEFGHVYGEI